MKGTEKDIRWEVKDSSLDCYSNDDQYPDGSERPETYYAELSVTLADKENGEEKEFTSKHHYFWGEKVRLSDDDLAQLEPNDDIDRGFDPDVDDIADWTLDGDDVHEDDDGYFFCKLDGSVDMDSARIATDDAIMDVVEAVKAEYGEEAAEMVQKHLACEYADVTVY